MAHFAAETTTPAGRQIILALAAPEAHAALPAQLTTLDYHVWRATSRDALRQALIDWPEAPLLLDAGWLDRSQEAARALREEILRQRSCAVITTEDDFATRMACVALDARALIKLPLDIPTLSERLEVLYPPTRIPPAQVFTLDRATHDPLSVSLCDAQLSVRAFHKPSTLFDALRDTLPELILLDMEQELELGIAVTRAIRQDANLLGVPVLIATEDASIGPFLRAIEAGCDNFLEKPLSQAHLLALVRPRVARFRSLRAMMLTDGLTGLYNHSHFKDRLQALVAQSARTQRPVSLAMLDIDRFKQINDQHGHPAGDRVLKHLAHLLRQRLRRTDLLGRYGGDEFAILMLDTPIEEAARIMEQVRARFMELEHTSPTGPFRTSFSCGLATSTRYTSEAALTLAADTALYEAKRRGKDQVVAQP